MLDPSKFWEFSLPQIVRVTVHPPIFTSGMGDQDVVDLREQVWKTIHQAIENEN
jgi:hypothetical protein